MAKVDSISEKGETGATEGEGFPTTDEAPLCPRESEPEPPAPAPSEDSVWDELDAAYTAGYTEGYTEGVNNAYDQ